MKYEDTYLDEFGGKVEQKPDDHYQPEWIVVYAFFGLASLIVIGACVL